MNTSLDTRNPPLVVSSRDLDRIEALLEAPAYRNLPGIAALRKELDRASIVSPEEVPAGVVTMNSQVLFRERGTNEEYGLTLVYPGPNNPPGAVSIFAPVGSALLGLSVGQSISWQVPGGRELLLDVLDVIYQPEARGEYHR